MLVVAAAMRTAWAGFETVEKFWALPHAPAQELQDGVIYEVQNSGTIDFKSNEGFSPVSVASNATAVLYIHKDVTLELRGADAVKQSGATPGLRIPVGSTLIVTGEGTLIATGGNAADGGNGGNGGNADMEGDYAAGSGGAGGSGGGGAAAGIGGGGGKGGKGGAATTTVAMETDYDKGEDWEGSVTAGNIAGNPGEAGGAGEMAGTLYVMGCAKVTGVKGVRAAKGGGWGMHGYGAVEDEATWDDWSAGGGGGGAGGAGGGEAPAGIGGGGGGGGGGGSGASGTTLWWRDVDETGGRKWADGHGGKGGQGDVDSVRGADGAENAEYAQTCDKGADQKGNRTRPSLDGGAGGYYSGDGGQMRVFNSASATIVGIVQSATGVSQGKEPAAIVYDVEFRDFDAVFQVRHGALGGSYPVPTLPQRANYVFCGYFTGRNGSGEMYYDSKLKLQVEDIYRRFEGLRLYASWRPVVESAPIEVGAGENVTIDGADDDPVRYQPAEGRMVKIAYGGTLTLKNLTFCGSDMGQAGMILNEGTLFVSNCVFRDACAMNGWGGVYSDRPGAKAVFYACTFKGNAAWDAGALAAEGSEVTAVHCAFAENRAAATVGGPVVASAVCGIDRAKLNIVSCTFADNGLGGDDGELDSPIVTSLGVDLKLINTICIHSANGTARAVHDDTVGLGMYVDPGSTVSSNFCVIAAEPTGLLGPADLRTCGPVDQVTFKPLGDARMVGCPGLIYHSADWSRFATEAGVGDCTAPIEADQVGQHPLDCWVGARTGNTLQHLINVTPSGGTLVVPPGAYDAVTVDKSIRVTGVDREKCVVNGDALEPCVTVTGAGESIWWDTFTFTNGLGTCGGGWQGVAGAGVGGTVSNCTFAACAATNGGAVAYADLVSDCLFDRCRAVTSGGGTYGCTTVERSIYSGCSAGAQGGASAGDDEVRTSLLVRNTAPTAGAGYETVFHLDTLVQNGATDETTANPTCYDTEMVGCILYGNKLPTDLLSEPRIHDSVVLATEKFVDAANGDYHLALNRLNSYTGDRVPVDQSAAEVTYADLKSRATEGRWLDLEGYPVVNSAPYDPLKFYLYGGCFAYVPFKVGGLVVTGPDDYYDFTNLRTSLREAIEEARRHPEYATDGELRVTFSPEVFGDGTNLLYTLKEPQIDVDVFTNATLAILPPAGTCVTFDGGGRHRGFRVRANNRLRVENMVFTHCLGAPEGRDPIPGANGGAVLNFGLFSASNCVFSGNLSGSTKGNYDNRSGYGGAVCNHGGATNLMTSCTFANNEALRGGAIYSAVGSLTEVMHATFVGNKATGLGMENPAGGAIATELPTTTTSVPVVLANCTVTSNHVDYNYQYGGGIIAKRGLVLLNSIVVGNTNNKASDDIHVTSSVTRRGEATFVNSIYGTRTASTVSGPIDYTDVDSTGGVGVLDALADTVPYGDESAVVPHLFVPVAEGLPFSGVWVCVAPNAAIGYLDGSVVVTNFTGKNSALVRKATRLETDQIGQVFSAPIVGAVALVGIPEPEEPEEPEDPPEDPPEEPSSLAEGELSDDVPVSDTDVLLRCADGKVRRFKNAECAGAVFRPGDTVCAATGSPDEAMLDDLVDVFYSYMHGYVSSREWFKVVISDDWTSYALVLDEEKAMPDVSGFELSGVGGEGAVEVMPGNLKPGLWYTLARAEAPSGPFVPQRWVQAGEDGNLPGALTAPATGASGFYRVIVAPYPPTEGGE